MSKLQDLYIECMNCKNSTAQCPGTMKNLQKGQPPRGFYFESEKIQILVVGKNPGHLIDNEADVYKGKSGVGLYNSFKGFHKKYMDELFASKDKSSTYHKNLYRYLNYFLNGDAHKLSLKELYKQVANTNIVKCSTDIKRDKLKKGTMDECYHKYLKKEIELFQPKVILALGREVYNYLTKINELGIPVVYIKHPSYFYKKQEEKKILKGIKHEMDKYLKKVK